MTPIFRIAVLDQDPNGYSIEFLHVVEGEKQFHKRLFAFPHAIKFSNFVRNAQAFTGITIASISAPFTTVMMAYSHFTLRDVIETPLTKNRNKIARRAGCTVIPHSYLYQFTFENQSDDYFVIEMEFKKDITGTVVNKIIAHNITEMLKNYRRPDSLDQTKIITVKSCMGCPYRHYFPSDVSVCYNGDVRTIPNSTFIPKWCPLENKSDG